MKSKKGFAGIAALIAVVVAIIAGGAYVMVKNVKVEPSQNHLEVELPSDQLATSTGLNFAEPNLETGFPSEPTADWQTYRNEEYGFEFKYPNGWNVTSGPGIVPPDGAFLSIHMSPPTLPSQKEFIGVAVEAYSSDVFNKIETIPLYERSWWREGNGNHIFINGSLMTNTAEGNRALDQILSTFKFTK